MLAAKVKLQDDLKVSEGVEHINRLERELKQKHSEIGWCFIEPDLYD